MGAVTYYSHDLATDDQLIFLHDFVTAASSVNGTFSILYSTGGAVVLDYS
ncbi:MAG: hypothetical protein OEM84_15030 [Acidimicrobiia bacterium]|nr:hypothetical protein [Acidimicrobiia bacterium]